MRSTASRCRWPNPLLAAVVALVLLAAGCGDEDTSDDGAAAESVTTGSSAPTTSTTDPASTNPSVADEAGDDSRESADEDGVSGELFPDVLAATAQLDGDGSWTFSATLSSPYDTASRYADAWRVVGPDGQVYGIRELAHDHASEQPFTRSQSGIMIPDDVTTVIVEGRDQVSGWGGATVEVDLQR